MSDLQPALDPIWQCDSIWDPYANLETHWAQIPAQEMLLRYPDAINVCAPMVRYSKHAFRSLVSLYNTQITTTPMILATEFSRSSLARDADFSTSHFERGFFTFEKASARRRRTTSSASQEKADWELEERVSREHVRGSLICQMAAHEPQSLADAAELVAPYVDGIDLNCGCPQPWAFSEGIGSGLLRNPDLIRDLIRGVKGRLGDGFCMSVKIRVDPDLKRTDQLVRTALHAGASILTIHGRTRHQASDSYPVNLEAIKFAIDTARACGCQTACAPSTPTSTLEANGKPVIYDHDGGGAGGIVPCVANGDVWDLAGAQETRRRTGAEGVMSARGLLANPALFAGYASTPPEAIREFAVLGTALGGMPAQSFHRHLAYMLEARLRRNELVTFNSLGSTASVLDYLGTDGFLGNAPQDPWDALLASPPALSWSSSTLAKRLPPANP